MVVLSLGVAFLVPSKVFFTPDRVVHLLCLNFCTKFLNLDFEVHFKAISSMAVVSTSHKLAFSL